MKKFKCSYKRLAPLAELVPNPRNPNKHPKKQIEHLAKIIDFQGQRSPIVVSKRSGFIVKGHGTLEAIKWLGWSECAVDEQDFESEAVEFAHMTADNEIARYAELDLDQLKLDMQEIDFDIDLDLLGIKDFELSEMPQEIDLQDESEVEENYTFKIKCSSLADLATVQHHFDCTGEKIDFEKFLKVIQ